MTQFIIDLNADPRIQVRIDSFKVPANARAEFEGAMRRSMAFLETLPGFRGHLAFEKTSGSPAFNIVTMAVWESPEAIANAVGAVETHNVRIGYDARATAARLGITTDIGNHFVPLLASAIGNLKGHR